ncbi:hypothetical protein AALP_AA8G266500 [Arabis alpina]|uniref:Response regulatory domain-containing protein n=2 Tax=Arabis alpina TaxID=50452 RepID=A0A087G9M4_ARAAL|nr:hypothetical protein AALP_AA8G266500 [Arabis alpina]
MAVKCDHRGIQTSDGGPNTDLPNSCDIVSGQFPEGLRVLVFDEDPVYRQVLEKHLQEFRYQVWICNEEDRAMHLLRNHRDRFDIAIIEAQDSKGDRFRLISEIGLEMDIPVIIMSKDDSVESVVDWMRNGACDYLIKPIRPEDLRMIFKHVAMKMQGRRSVAAGEAEEKVGGTVAKSSSVGDSTIRNPNKRKRGIDEDHDHDRCDRTSTSKKRRVVWEDELHKKFLAAVEQLGLANAVPKKILELMNDPSISRENVASHLQKFRIHLKKQEEQKERDQKNISLTTQREGRTYGGEEATDFHKGGDVQFPTFHIDNIPGQPWMQQQHITNTNLTTQLVSPLGHHHLGDGVSVAVSSRNLVMTHHHHHTSELACIENTQESLGYNNFEMHNEEEAAVGNLTCLYMQNSQDLFQFHEPVMATTTMIPNHHHSSASLQMSQPMSNGHVTESAMLHSPSFPSSYTHNSFLDQQEILTMVDECGVFNYDSAYSVNNNKVT